MRFIEHKPLTSKSDICLKKISLTKTGIFANRDIRFYVKDKYADDRANTLGQFFERIAFKLRPEATE